MVTKKSEQNYDKVKISRSNFIRLCPDFEGDYPWYQVKPNGIYLNEGYCDDIKDCLFTEELLFFREHPEDDETSPLLNFPCKVNEFESFIKSLVAGKNPEETLEKYLKASPRVPRKTFKEARDLKKIFKDNPEKSLDIYIKANPENPCKQKDLDNFCKQYMKEHESIEDFAERMKATGISREELAKKILKVEPNLKHHKLGALIRQDGGSKKISG